MIQIAVAGCGAIARGRHIPAYEKNPNTRLYAFYDPAPGRAQELAQAYGGRGYETYDALLEDPAVDAVSVCTPERFHSELTVRALRAGKHVLCEKPMAMNAAEALEMEHAARESQRVLMISHNQRIYEQHMKAKELLEAGVIGRPLSFRTFLSHRGAEYYAMDGNNGDYYDRHQGSGGVMLSVGYHRVDLIHYLFGSRIAQVASYMPTMDKRLANGSLIGAEDHAMVLLKLENGLGGMLYSSWCNYGGEDQSTQIFGTEGVLKAYDGPYAVTVERKNGEILHVDLSRVPGRGSVDGTPVIDQFVDCLSRGTRPCVPPSEGVACMKVIDAIARSHLTRRWEPTGAGSGGTEEA